ncbi:ATP-binding protein [Sphingomonas xinjiangensis]|uniref:histidine kinase n=1 Tax=Sphingomonas xinjiangensis TaxID=643568 RepID=A0A840YQL1_9SPHN|nr:ATP-binding protein [Sphingomonas xinjiangensis]MBB5710603.1 signal transduction histidine kinase/CheY-like chemotaxis protein [Sphingomonas xinjiangensis]
MTDTAVAMDTEQRLRDTNWRLKLLGALALLGIGVLGALIFLQYRTEAQRDEAIRLQQHTFEVIIRTNQLSGAISSAEAALGRYVVSADKRLGQQYVSYWARAGEQLLRLRQLTGDNRGQQSRIRALQAAFAARGKELDETALYSTYKRHNDAWGSYYRVRQSPARTRLEALLAQVVDSERLLLRDRTEAAADLLQSSTYASRILTLFGVLIVLGAILLGWLAIQAQGEKAAADAEAHAERERAIALQEAVSAATKQLREEAREREQAEAQLRQIQKMEAVGQLTGGIAHDFNNMLAVVLGGLEMAKRQLNTSPSDARRHIDNAMDGAGRAAALTRRLLAFSRSEPLLPEAVEAASLIAGMSDLLDRTLGDTIAVETQDTSHGWCVFVDKHQLENAVLNLAVNARDAMNGRGRLTIATGQADHAIGQGGERVAGEFVTLAVSDTGCGMAPGVMERVFEPFFTTKPVGKGTGLGLSQIFGFARQSGGEISLDSREGEGTTVTLYLPRHAGVAAAAPEVAVSQMATSDRAYDILVVEDDPRVLNATVGALEELGHRVTACPDPLQAPEAVDGMAALDLILSDVLMPTQTGPEMIAALGERIKGVAVLFVTGFAGEVDAEIFAGRSVLRKPFTMAGLARAVDEAVELEGGRGTRVAAE